ncbi:MAG: hypothetical protein QM765_33055 [Myxococcales bacterium]
MTRASRKRRWASTLVERLAWASGAEASGWNLLDGDVPADVLVAAEHDLGLAAGGVDAHEGVAAGGLAGERLAAGLLFALRHAVDRLVAAGGAEAGLAVDGGVGRDEGGGDAQRAGGLGAGGLDVIVVDDHRRRRLAGDGRRGAGGGGGGTPGAGREGRLGVLDQGGLGVLADGRRHGLGALELQLELRALGGVDDALALQVLGGVLGAAFLAGLQRLGHLRRGRQAQFEGEAGDAVMGLRKLARH